MMSDKSALPQAGNVAATLSYLSSARPGTDCDELLAALPALARLPVIPDDLSRSCDIVAQVVEQLCPGHATMAWSERGGQHVCLVSPAMGQLDDFRWCARGQTLALAYLSAAMAMLHGFPPGWQED